MKKLLAIILFILLTSTVSAHPGKKDENGCHICRTNCEKYGLEYGEYHCHNEVNPSSHEYSSSGNGGSYFSGNFSNKTKKEKNHFIEWFLVIALSFVCLVTVTIYKTSKKHLTKPKKRKRYQKKKYITIQKVKYTQKDYDDLEKIYYQYHGRYRK